MMARTFTFVVLLCGFLLCEKAAFAQISKNKKEGNGRDFIDVKVPRLVPNDTASTTATFKNGLQNGGDITQKADTLVAADSGNFQIQQRKTQNRPANIGGPNLASNPDSEKLRQEIRSYYRSRGFDKDTLVIKNLFKELPPVLEYVDLNVHQSMMREDTTFLYDVEEEDIVEVSEEVQVDSIWVKLTGYYAIWDSHNINPYKFNIDDFKDSVNIALFDTLQNHNWSLPLASLKLTSEFGMRGWRWHHGIDLDLDTGDPVLAAFDGIVRVRRYERGGYGNFVVLRHYNGLETLYGHLSRHVVKVGDEVKAGQLIGLGGSTGRSTGPHLHYEVRYNGYAFDPKYIYDFENNRIVTDIFMLKPEHFKHLSSQRQVVYHRIRYGDSLGRIARKYRTSINTLCRLNGIGSRAILRTGRKLRVR